MDGEISGPPVLAFNLSEACKFDTKKCNLVWKRNNDSVNTNLCSSTNELSFFSKNILLVKSYYIVCTELGILVICNVRSVVTRRFLRRRASVLNIKYNHLIELLQGTPTHAFDNRSRYSSNVVTNYARASNRLQKFSSPAYLIHIRMFDSGDGERVGYGV